MIAFDFTRADAAPTIKPYGYCVVDLETMNCSADVIERVIRKASADWQPPGNYKDPDKIAAMRSDAMARLAEKSAVWDEAPIATVALKSDSEFRLLHALGAEPPRLVAGATVQGFAGEREMLVALRALVGLAWVHPESPPDQVGIQREPTLIVGHNVMAFDLPKIRLRMLANRLQLPRCLTLDLPVFDTMRRWNRFSRDQRPFIPFADVADALGVAPHKQVMTGADVPACIAAGKIDQLVDYALLDVLAEESAFLKMTGRHPEFN